MFDDKRMSKGGRKSEDVYHINRHTVRKSCSEIMDTRLRYRHINKRAKKRKRHFGKPWWCEELNIYGKRHVMNENIPRGTRNLCFLTNIKCMIFLFLPYILNAKYLAPPTFLQFFHKSRFLLKF